MDDKSLLKTHHGYQVRYLTVKFVLYSTSPRPSSVLNTTKHSMGSEKLSWRRHGMEIAFKDSTWLPRVSHSYLVLLSVGLVRVLLSLLSQRRPPTRGREIAFQGWSYKLV